MTKILITEDLKIGRGERALKLVAGTALLATLVSAYAGWIEMPEAPPDQFSGYENHSNPTADALGFYYVSLGTAIAAIFGLKWVVESAAGEKILFREPFRSEIQTDN